MTLFKPDDEFWIDIRRAAAKQMRGEHNKRFLSDLEKHLLLSIIHETQRKRPLKQKQMQRSLEPISKEKRRGAPKKRPLELLPEVLPLVQKRLPPNIRALSHGWHRPVLSANASEFDEKRLREMQPKFDRFTEKYFPPEHRPTIGDLANIIALEKTFACSIDPGAGRLATESELDKAKAGALSELRSMSNRTDWSQRRVILALAEAWPRLTNLKGKSLAYSHNESTPFARVTALLLTAAYGEYPCESPDSGKPFSLTAVAAAIGSLRNRFLASYSSH